MARNNRIFVSFAIEDEYSRILLVGQASNEKCPFEFVGMSVKEPWNEQWQSDCRNTLKGCDGVIALVSQATASSDGALWELRCATEEKLPVRGVYVDASNKPWNLPAEFAGVLVVEWNWPIIKSFFDSL